MSTEQVDEVDEVDEVDVVEVDEESTEEVGRQEERYVERSNWTCWLSLVWASTTSSWTTNT